MSIYTLFTLANIHLHKVQYTPSQVILHAVVNASGASCPRCGLYSQSVHGFYERWNTDLPVFEYATIVKLRTRKFKCKNPECVQKVFSE